ncbi:MAG: hypothetical protein C5B60_00260 [Chloroflexi bacterium]|nr:MAG: hypothetical protein C5B60_00260 [Chloroflexota bacterium]
MRLCSARVLLYITTILLLSLLPIAIVACASSGSGSATNPAGGRTGTGGSVSGTPGALPPTVTPTTSIASPGTGEGGIAEFCASPPDVESSLPASIPSYPHAEMRVSKISGGSGVFGLCTKDPTSAVVSFYLAQLPAKGWQQITQNSIVSVKQIQASKGSGFLTITVEPDGQLSSTTDIIIQTSGVS